MHRAVLQACLPCLIALAVACAALTLLARMSGARLQWRRLRELHRCQDGGVQSLAFVLTLPMLIVIVQFIVQVSQLMIATMIVNYATYAAARSASVWIPAEVGLLPENEAGSPLTADNPLVLTYEDRYLLQSNYKYRQIFKAATLACAPIAPSRDLGISLDPSLQTAAESTRAMYAALVPDSRQNGRIPRRIDNKLAYSWQHTAVRIRFVDKDTQQGPTYNPRWPVERTLPNGETETTYTWNPHEVGWQDPLTLTVSHELALLPGVGRFLAHYLVRADGQPDRVSERIQRSGTYNRRPIYTTPVWATVTITNEGIKSVIPYVQESY